MRWPFETNRVFRISRAKVLVPAALVLLWPLVAPLPFLPVAAADTTPGAPAAPAGLSDKVANPFDEVPAGHWSYRALETLSATGILPELVPGTYVPPGASVGYRAITRLEMAILTARFVARLSELAQVRVGEVLVRPTGTAAEGELTKIINVYNAANPGKKPLTILQISALERLVHEYAGELSILGERFPLIAGARSGGGSGNDAGGANAAARERSVQSVAYAGSVGGFRDLDEIDTRAPGASGVPGVPGVPGASGIPPVSGAPGASGAPGTSRASQSFEARPLVVLELPPLLPGVDPAMERPGAVNGLSPKAWLAGGSAGFPETRGLVPGEVLLDTTLALEADSLVRQVATVKGQYRLGEKFMLTGEFSGDARVASPNNGAVKVGASVKVGEVEVGAGLQNTPATPVTAGGTGTSFLPVNNPAVPNPSFKGYNISFKFGKVAVSTGMDSLQVGHDPGTAKVVEKAKGVDLGYNLTETATVKAGYALVDSDAVGAAGKEGASGPAKAKASLALDLRLPNAQKLRAGVSVERPALNNPPNRTDGSLGDALNGQPLQNGVSGNETNVDKTGATPVPTTTTFGLGYDFSPNSSLLLYYKLITIPGITELEKELANVAAAELSIKF